MIQYAVVVNAAKANVKRMRLDTEPHANCLRAFERLYHADSGQAQAYFVEVSEYLRMIST